MPRLRGFSKQAVVAEIMVNIMGPV
jgi:hypothetical protein